MQQALCCNFMYDARRFLGQVRHGYYSRPARSSGSGSPLRVVVGQTTEVSGTFLILGQVRRIDLPTGLSNGFRVGHSVTVTVVAVDGKDVAESIVVNRQS